MSTEEIIQENIENNNYEHSSDEIICPYCGYSEEVEYEMYFGDTPVSPYIEGEEMIECPECKHTFRLLKELTWEYATKIY